MRLPDTVVAPGIPPDTEFDAMFSMTPKKLASKLRVLSVNKSILVVVWIRKFREGNEVFFFKQMYKNSKYGDSSDEDIEGSLRIHAGADTDPEGVRVEMEERISDRGVRKFLCVTCLHDYIDRTCIECPEATRVALYMAEDVDAFMFCTVPGGDNRAFFPPESDICSHEMSEREEVRHRPMLYLIKRDSDDDDDKSEMGEERGPEDAEDKGGDGNVNDNVDDNVDDNADGNGDDNEDGNGDDDVDETGVAAAKAKRTAEEDEEERNKRQKLNP